MFMQWIPGSRRNSNCSGLSRQGSTRSRLSAKSEDDRRLSTESSKFKDSVSPFNVFRKLSFRRSSTNVQEAGGLRPDAHSRRASNNSLNQSNSR